MWHSEQASALHNHPEAALLTQCPHPTSLQFTVEHKYPAQAHLLQQPLGVVQLLHLGLPLPWRPATRWQGSLELLEDDQCLAKAGQLDETGCSAGGRAEVAHVQLQQVERVLSLFAVISMLG